MSKARPVLAAAAAAALLGLIPATATADVAIGDLTAVGLAFDGGDDVLFVAGADAGPVVAVFDEAGARKGDVTFSGRPVSVQALALADGVLHVADIGDEKRDREFVTVFGVAPEPGRQSYKAWDFAYPDGPHDAKAFLISGKGRFYFITTGDEPGIYRADLNPSRDGVNRLTRAADAPAGVTDAAFLDDGETMLVRTADGVVLIDAFTWETKATTTYVGGAAGESVTPFGRDGMLVGARSPLREEPLPQGRTTVTPGPAPASTPTGSESVEPSRPSPSPTASATATAAPEEPEVTYEVSRSGTLLALIGALALSLLAGAFVFFRR